VLVLRFFIPELAIDPETLHIAPLSTRSALVFMITVLASVWTTIAIIVKRAHDCGLTGLIAGFALVPLIGYILILFLGFTPGTAGSNNYGERTNAP